MNYTPFQNKVKGVLTMVKIPAVSAQNPRIPARKLTVTAVLMAMNIIMSISALSVPVPGGHMYLNDVIIVTAAVRLMGKRQVSDMQTSELVITLIISEVASLPLENAERPLLNSLVPIMVIVAIELLVSLLMMKSKRFRSLICGHPIIIIKDGQMIDSQLKKLRISREDVYSLLREKDIADESTVRWGIIEPNGTLSVLTDEALTDNGIQSGDLQEQEQKSEQEDNE